MKQETDGKRNLYFTTDHEWIDYQGSVAYTGVCGFKLIGCKEIHALELHNAAGFKKKGEKICTLIYNDYKIPVHMPVDGKIIEINNKVLYENPCLLLQRAETEGWIALIVPSQPYERKSLLLPREYQLNGKSKYAKQ